MNQKFVVNHDGNEYKNEGKLSTWKHKNQMRFKTYKKQTSK